MPSWSSASVPQPDKMIVMGQVSAPYGIKGWIKVRPYTETMDSLLDFPVWWLGGEGGWQESRVLEAHVHGKSIVADIEASRDRSAAEKLKGLQIAVPRASLPVAGKNEYYWSDLVGLKVVNPEGVELGLVRSVIETGANDVLEVDGGGLIPFISRYILEVDLKSGKILADWGADW